MSVCDINIHVGLEYQLRPTAKDAVILYEDRTPTPSRERGERTAQEPVGHSQDESAFPISDADGKLY